MQLLDTFMPEYDRSVRQTTDVRANAAALASWLLRTDLGGCEVVRVLLARSCSRSLLDGATPSPGRLTLEEFQALGCVVLTSPDAHEVAVGAMGTVSAERFEPSPADVERFCDGGETNVARMLWHFGVEPAGFARSILTVETRLRCAGAGHAQRLLLRWDALEPLRARARREVLLAMKARAERGDTDTRARRNLGLNRD
jgi:hypothetical protein